MSESQKENKPKKTKSSVEKVIMKDEEYDEGEFIFRWYHGASLVIVLGLLILAGVTFFRRYDLSLIGSERQLRISYGCTEGDAEPDYRYFGVADGDMFKLDGKKIKRTDSEDDAILKLGVINGKPEFNVKENGEWKTERLEFGAEGTYVLDEVTECKPGIKVHLSV